MFSRVCVTWGLNVYISRIVAGTGKQRVIVNNLWRGCCCIYDSIVWGWKSNNSYYVIRGEGQIILYIPSKQVFPSWVSLLRHNDRKTGEGCNSYETKSVYRIGIISTGVLKAGVTSVVQKGGMKNMFFAHINWGQRCGSHNEGTKHDS